MPIGSYTFVPEIAAYLEKQHPRTVLDLGIGAGFYAAVVRQWGDQGVRPWQTYLIGVESWIPYRNPLWDLYNVVVTTPIESFLQSLRHTYELILLLDVIEHFEPDAGLRVLERTRQALTPKGRLYVGTPAVFMPQGIGNKNTHETHRSLWTSSDFQQLGFRLERDGSCCSYGSQMLLAVYEHAEA
ncbi:MAG: class I SAM-dependent methyltransferase [Pirellulaceae bacterium]